MRSPTYDEQKFRELIVYLALRCEADPTFGATKLNKILFFADFGSYETTGSSITGAAYQRLDHGPAPRRLVPVRDQLIAEGALLERRVTFGLGAEQRKPVALREPVLSIFTAAEMSRVESIVQAVWGKSAREVSAMSHHFMGWQLASSGETIPYSTVLIERDPTPLEPEQQKQFDDIVAGVFGVTGATQGGA